MNRRKEIKLFAIVLIVLSVFLTIGYSAFNAVVDVKDLSMHIRPDKDIRITNVTLGENSGVNGGLSYNEDWTKQTVFGDISLPNSNSSVKYTVEVKNLGFVDMAIYGITLPSSISDKLNVEITNYTLGDTIAHGTQMMDITLSYKSGQYVSSSTLFNNIVLTFDFQEAKPSYMYNSKTALTVGRTGTIDKKTVEKISFDTTNVVPSDALGSFDMSEDNDESIMAWYYDTDGNSKYELVIGSKNGVVYAPEDSFRLFAGDYKGDRQYYNLTTIDFTNFSTEYVTSMNSIFYLCNALKTVNVTSFDTSNVTDMSSMFYSCKALTTINLTSFNTSSVTNMASMFAYCNNLSNLDLSKFDTSKVTNMRAMFSGCYELKSLDLSNFDTSKVTDMSSMFYSCKALTTINLTSFNTSSVTNMASMFAYCNNLSNLDLSKFDTSKVTNMRAMFNECSKLSATSMAVYNFDTSNVTDMSYMFYGCKSLGKSFVTTGWDTSKVTNMSYMFNGVSCESLEISGFDTSNVTNMSYMFANIGNVNFPSTLDFNTSNVTNMNHMFYNYKNGLATALTLNFDTSKVTNMNYMFSGASSLKTLKLSNFTSTSLIKNAYMFQNMTSLTLLTLGGSSLFKLTTSNALSGSTIASGTGYVAVPSSLLSTYKAASFWSKYNSRIISIKT